MFLDFVGSASQPSLGLLSYLLGPFKPKQAGDIILPTGAKRQTPTSTAQIQRDLEALQSKAQEWAELDNAKKAKLFKRCSEAAFEAIEEGARLLTEAKGSYGHGLGEERCSLLSPIIGFRDYSDSLSANGQPKPKAIRKNADGQYIAEVFPTGYDSIFFGGFRGEVWIQPGKEPTQGASCKKAAGGGGVGLVLGAGNQIPVALLDIAHMLVVENAVVICKMNPILDYLRPYVEKMLAPLIEEGYVKLAFGGLEQGSFLTSSPIVSRVHLTGSAATYDAIVWQGKPKVGSPPFKKPMTAELGCVTPVIITPGHYSKEAINYHADECVAGLVTNAGHNCCKNEVLITARDWPQRKEFMNAVRSRLDQTPCKVAWYPGSVKKHAAFLSKFPHATKLGSKLAVADEPEEYLPWALAEGLTPEQADLTTENWCGVLQEVALPGTGADVSEFLTQAVNLANDRCWGTLSCSLLAPPEVDKAIVESAIRKLRYGAVAVNLPAFVAFTFARLSWGAHPGHGPQDIQSGRGYVHNSMLFDHPQKSVIYAPWIHHPVHLWSPHVKNLDNTSYYAAKFQAYPGLLSLSMTALNALRG